MSVGIKAVKTIFIIWSPDYTHLSSGVRCLFLLCHHLNHLGYEAYISGKDAPLHLMAPCAAPEKVSQLRADGNRFIAIYPEILKENVFSCAQVVRYLLNKPGIMSTTLLTDFSSDEYFVHYADEFVPAGVRSRKLRIPTLDTKIYNSSNAAAERRGFLLYSSRVVPDPAWIPDWVFPRTLITSANPIDPATLASLYRSSRALVTWERTAAITEAIHCGCPVILAPHPTFEHDAIVRRNLGCGVAVGWDPGSLTRARRSLPISTGWYRLRSILLSRRIDRFAKQARRHFGYQA